MKYAIKMMIVISLFTQICHAQAIRTADEYRVEFDSIAARLKRAQKDTSTWIGKPVSELVKILAKNDLKINKVSMQFEDRKIPPQFFYGMRLWLISDEADKFIRRSDDFTEPGIVLEFTKGKSYEKALSLLRKYQVKFTEEVEEFYSDAVIKSIVEIYIPDDMYPLRVRERMEGEKMEREKRNN